MGRWERDFVDSGAPARVAPDPVQFTAAPVEAEWRGRIRVFAARDRT